MTLQFDNNQPNDFLAILREAGQWLIAMGDPMWELDTLFAGNLFNEYTLGNCYVMYADGFAAASFILQWKDPLYYPEVPDGTAGFIHKLAIRRQFSGKGFFYPILDFCRRQCLARNINQIQLETDATRPSLIRFYERFGFQATYQKTIQEFGQTFNCQYYVLDF